MKLRLPILAAVGVALALYLVRYVGWHGVLSAAGAIGWTGFAVFCLCALLLFVLLGAAWQVLLPASCAPRLWLLVRARLVRDAGAEVLPFSQIGGIALGVQEGAYVLLAPLFGVGTDTALAMSVLKRARDVAIGVPVLLLWQAAEGRRALTAVR